MSQAKVVGGNEDISIKIPGFEGFEMIVKANSVTFPDGSRMGPLVISPVHADRLPMVPPGGSATFMAPAWTIQPSGTRFDPPIEVRIPNSRNLKPGETSQIYQWDHDLATFVPMGQATVSEDGALLVTDVGSGVSKAGWGGAPPTPPSPPNCGSGGNSNNGPTEAECGEQCKTYRQERSSCGTQSYCLRTLKGETSEKYSCCGGDKYNKDSECCVKVPTLTDEYVKAEKNKPFAEQSGVIQRIAQAIPVANFSNQPMQHKGPPLSLADGNPFLPEKVGDINHVVDGCSVPSLLQLTFTPGLFINKAISPNGNSHPYSEPFYQACKAHDFCYQTCGTQQSDCDTVLYNYLRASCDGIPQTIPGSGFYSPEPTDPNSLIPGFQRTLFSECVFEAGKVYAGLVVAGRPAHSTRQREMCLVCK